MSSDTEQPTENLKSSFIPDGVFRITAMGEVVDLVVCIELVFAPFVLKLHGFVS